MNAELDPEIAAMAQVYSALEPLSVASRQRVLDWTTARMIPGGTDPLALVNSTIALAQSFVTAVEEHKGANPEPSDADKALYAVVNR